MLLYDLKSGSSASFAVTLSLTTNTACWVMCMQQLAEGNGTNGTAAKEKTETNNATETAESKTEASSAPHHDADMVRKKQLFD